MNSATVCGWQTAGEPLQEVTSDVKPIRLAAYGGVAGPVFFTAAWVVSSLRQTGHPATGVQLSGLAAADARDPLLMMAAFVLLAPARPGWVPPSAGWPRPSQRGRG
jgi:hypothetical protein